MSLGILNVGAGDTKLTFDPSKPAELERSKRIVTDMLKRGFTILVEVEKRNGEPLYQRVREFDAATCEYIIAGDPGELENGTPEQPEAAEKNDAASVGKGDGRRRGRGSRGSYTKRVPAGGARAVAVGRTAGG